MLNIAATITLYGSLYQQAAACVKESETGSGKKKERKKDI